MSEYLNEIKIWASKNSLTPFYHLNITDQELDQFWADRNIVEMANILKIYDFWTINYFASELLPIYLSSKKIVTQAYIVSKSGKEDTQLMYTYDCRMFKAHNYSKQQCDFLSCWLLCFKNKGTSTRDQIYQIVDFNSLPDDQYFFQVKQSMLLRIWPLIKELTKKWRRSQRVIIDRQCYKHFVEQWYKINYSYNPSYQYNTLLFFKALLFLIENQILINFCNSVGEQKLRFFMYERPIKLVNKPNKVECSTATQQLLQINWQSLKIPVFKLKYKIKQKDNYYQCYQSQPKQQCYRLIQSQQDAQIMSLFTHIAAAQAEYGARFV